MQRSTRMKKELRMLAEDPPHGVSCWPVDHERIDHLEAKIIGAEETPYQGGIFKLDIQIPERYPFEPPKMRFITPIYHPNIDSNGRICLDTIKMPPKGMWKPALNIASVLSSILLLMDKPNPDDPLMADISNEFRYNHSQYVEKAKEWTLKYATEKPLESQGQLLDMKDTINNPESGLKTTTLHKKDNTIVSISDSDPDSESENTNPGTSPHGEKRRSIDEPSTSGIKPQKIPKL